MRHGSLDFFKLLLAFMVVALHSSIFSDVNEDLSFYLVNGLFRIAVPIFFIASGFFFVDSVHSFKNLSRWVLRLVKLYVFWMVVYSPFYFVEQIDKGALRLVKELVVGYWHLWYVSALISSGLFLYFYSVLSLRWKLYGLLVLYVLGVFLQYYSVLSGKNFPYWFYRNFIFFGIPMFGLGFLYRQHENFASFIKHNRFFFLVLFISLYVLEVYFARRVFGVDDAMDMYFTLFFLCPAIFCCILLAEFKFSFSNARLSNFIYFSHPLGIIYLNAYPYFSRFEVFLISSIFSISLYFVFSFFPRLNKTLY
ncbi:acyltransferase [Curvibacter sp. RS43]|uniref:acyltransferase family protein n=1 Tax=Curvibacter microcysteis TaxID=3026419 RepID=UPI002361E329|nr:acyltransferase [Curvibacter sp. RS43]MDD0810209.1 acyltransferase [Curvibacter sp. RS43]